MIFYNKKSPYKKKKKSINFKCNLINHKSKLNKKSSNRNKLKIMITSFGKIMKMIALHLKFMVYLNLFKIHAI